MSRPKFFADHDFDGRILRELLKKEPQVDLIRAQDVGLAAVPDATLLEYAANLGRIVLTSWESTMIGAAVARLRAGQPMPGLMIARQPTPIGRVIDELLVIWDASEAGEWVN